MRLGWAVASLAAAALAFMAGYARGEHVPVRLGPERPGEGEDVGAMTEAKTEHPKSYGELLNLAAVAGSVPADVVAAGRLYRVPVAELVALLARDGRTFGDLAHDAAKARGRKR